MTSSGLTDDIPAARRRPRSGAGSRRRCRRRCRPHAVPPGCALAGAGGAGHGGRAGAGGAHVRCATGEPEAPSSPARSGPRMPRSGSSWPTTRRPVRCASRGRQAARPRTVRWSSGRSTRAGVPSRWPSCLTTSRFALRRARGDAAGPRRGDAGHHRRARGRRARRPADRTHRRCRRHHATVTPPAPAAETEAPVLPWLAGTKRRGHPRPQTRENDHEQQHRASLPWRA